VGQPIPGSVGGLFPQRPHLPPDVPGVPSPLRPRFGRGSSDISYLPPSVLIYVSSLHLEVPWSLVISYVDNFAVTVASPSYRTDIRLLQKFFSTLKRKASPINISFAVLKTELIHWRTTRSNEPPCSLPVQLEDQLFYPQSRLKWLGFIFTPSFDPRSLFSRRLSPCKCHPGHDSPPLPPRDWPSTLPLSLPCAFAPCSNPPIWIGSLEPSSVYHGPDVRFLASGL